MLEDIRQHIEKLIALYEAEKAENQRLRQELHECKETGASYRKQMMDLESQIETLKLSQAFGGTDTAEAREKIDRLIKEVDKCISWLER